MHKYLATQSLATLAFLSSLAQAPSPTTAKEWYDNGISLKESKSYKEAITAFKKATALKANYAEAFHQLGWCYNEESSYTEAIDALGKEFKAGSADLSGYNFELGYAYKGLKKYDEALTCFNKAIELDAEYTFAYKERGTTYYKLKKYDKVLDDLNKYEELTTSDITDADYYYMKGWTENDQEKYGDAVISLKKSVELDDSYTDGFSELGYSYYKLENNDNAIEAYRKAMVLDATDYHPILGTADVYYENVKNFDSAIVYYELGTRIQKKNKSAYYRLGWCYNDKGKYSYAILALKEAVLLDPDYLSARNELGYAYYKMDSHDEALAQFLPVMAKDAKDQLSRYYAGFCYYLKGDQEGLKKMIAQLRALNSTKYVETLTKYVK